MAIEGHEFSPKEKAEIMVFPLEHCCFCIPRLGPIQSASREEGRWARGVNTLMKVREWTEMAASLSLKIFIRRSKSGGGVRHGEFQYDPLCYALNFDDGEGQQNRDLDDEEYYVTRGSFSLRYAALPVSSNSPMDLGKDASTFT